MEEGEAHATSYTWPALWHGPPGSLFAITGTIAYGAFRTQKELKKACPEIILHAEVNHRDNLFAA